MKLFSPADTVDACGDTTLLSPSTCIILPVQWPVWTRPGAGSSYGMSLRFVPPTAYQTNTYQALPLRCDAGPRKGSTEIILQSVHEARVPSLTWSGDSVMCQTQLELLQTLTTKMCLLKVCRCVPADQARTQQQYQKPGMISVTSFTSFKWNPLEMSIYIVIGKSVLI